MRYLNFFFAGVIGPGVQFCLGGGGTQLCLLGSGFSTFWTRKVWYFFFLVLFFWKIKNSLFLDTFTCRFEPTFFLGKENYSEKILRLVVAPLPS